MERAKHLLEHEVKENGDSASIRHVAILQQIDGVRTRLQSLCHLEEDWLRVSPSLLTNSYILKS